MSRICCRNTSASRFSLTYEFAGFAGVHAADTRSGEMLHSYGHRITRGLLLYLGLPDGRWLGRERAEAAVCMTSSQARSVQSMGTGALVFRIATTAAPVPATNKAPADYLTPSEREAAECMPKALCFDSAVAVPEPLAAPKTTAASPILSLQPLRQRMQIASR